MQKQMKQTRHIQMFRLENTTICVMNLKSEVSPFPIYHCSNSAGIIDIKKANMDLVRAGISIYGLYPSEEVEKKNVPLRPAMESDQSCLLCKDSSGRNSGQLWRNLCDRKETSLATIPVGYGDGYPRSLLTKVMY